MPSEVTNNQAAADLRLRRHWDRLFRPYNIDIVGILNTLIISLLLYDT
jgi:hypothetical protein